MKGILYLAAVGIKPTPTPSTPSNPPPPTSLSVDDDPEDIDLALTSPLPPRVTRSKANQQQQQQIAQLEAMGLGGGLGGGPESMFAGMNGLGGMGGGAGGDMFAQMMASMNGSGTTGAAAGISTPGGGFATMPLGNFPPTPKTTIDRLFPLVHFFSMVGLAIYAIFWLEPARKFGLYGWMGIGETVDWRNWAELSGKAPARDMVTKMVGSGLAEVVSLI